MQPPPAQPGERYSIGEILGRGGMGVVYAARDEKQGRDVALKRLTLEHHEREVDRARATAQFEREYHTLSQLAHPHVIEVYDYHVDARGPFYTMERLRGASLRALAPLPWREACRLLRDIASALALVHSRRLVHRDITPLNVFCTAEGGAKLIDFGAMMPAGVAPHILGTPAFIAPECLQHAALDGQTDLFSLGATLYFALTGQHAYPAHSIASLRERWLTPPPAPSRLRPELPAALEQLVLALLALDASERPRSAVEVYERLTAIADLPRDERSEIGLGYLSKPALVGRVEAIAALRRAVEEAAAAHGGGVSVLAAGGLGRSRLLDAAALEAKLCGLSVARADASEGPSVPAAVIRRLLAGMLDEAPQLRAPLDELGLSPLATSQAAERFEQLGRDRALAGLNELMLRACAQRTWAIVIDDVHAIDEVSLAFIASLALQARSRRLLIVTSLDADAPTRRASGVALLEEASRKLRLEPLDASQGRALLSSLFGEVPNIDLLATVSEAVCEGKPRSILDAAERLIEVGLVRYHDGGFWISSDRDALVRAIASAGDLSHELGQLSADARELLELLALDVDAIMSLVDYPFLLEARDSARAHAALGELIAKHWLAASADRVRFRRDDRREALAERLEPDRRRQLQTRLAERARQLPISKIYAAHHFLGAGALPLAIDALDEFWRETESKVDSEILRQPVCLDTFEAVMHLPPVPEAHPALQAHHGVGATMNMLLRGMPERAAQHMSPVLRALAPFSGLADYAELSELAPQERVTQALTRAHARCAVPGKGGLPDVFRALRRQAQITIGSAATAFMMNDPSLLALIPDLRPFSAIAAPLGLVARVSEAIARLTRGQMWEGLEELRAVLSDLRGPLAAQIDPLTTLALTRTTLGYLGRMSAELGSPDTLTLIHDEPNLRADMTEPMRAVYWLAQGDLANADAARRHSEVLSARAGSNADARIVDLQAHVALFSLFDDVLGLRRAQLSLQQVTLARPHWRVRAELARAHALRCQGALERALHALERAVRDEHHASYDWHACAATQLELLNALRRHGETLELGEPYLQIARGAGSPCHRIALELALAHAELGHTERAERHLADAGAELETCRAGGVVLAQVHEVGARIALVRADRVAFAVRLAAWGDFIRVAKHPQLVARYNRLVRDGELAGAAIDESGALTIRDDTRELDALRELAREARGQDDAAFHQRLLELVLEQTDAVAGMLYTWSNEGPRCVARAGVTVFERELDQSVARYWSTATAQADASTGTTQSSEAEPSRMHASTQLGSAHLVRIDDVRDGRRVLQGVLALDLGPSPRPLRVSLAELGAMLADRARSQA